MILAADILGGVVPEGRAARRRGRKIEQTATGHDGPVTEASYSRFSSELRRLLLQIRPPGENGIESENPDSSD